MILKAKKLIFKNYSNLKSYAQSASKSVSAESAKMPFPQRGAKMKHFKMKGKRYLTKEMHPK